MAIQTENAVRCFIDLLNNCSRPNAIRIFYAPFNFGNEFSKNASREFYCATHIATIDYWFDYQTAKHT